MPTIQDSNFPSPSPDGAGAASNHAKAPAAAAPDPPARSSCSCNCATARPRLPIAPRGRRAALHTLLRLIVVGAFLAITRSIVADWNDVPTGSMRPTILEGDRIVVDKLAFGLRVPFTESWLATWSAPRRGDVVTFASPVDGIRMVKRVVGLPGDHVRLDNNAVIINGVAAEYNVHPGRHYSPAPDGTRLPVVEIDEDLPTRDAAAPAAPHQILLTPGLPSPRSIAELTVPPGVYFVMGDNRDLSNDSRLIGFVPRANIYGRVRAIALSVDPWSGYHPRWERWFSGVR